MVFKYLLSVRRVQAELQHCWALQMQRKHLKSNQTDAIKWRLRNHMAFLVDNLQYYLQVYAKGGGYGRGGDEKKSRRLVGVLKRNCILPLHNMPGFENSCGFITRHVFSEDFLGKKSKGE